MMELFLKEIKNNNILIRNINSSQKKEEGNKLLFSTVKKMCDLSRQARSLGLLALEEKAKKLETFPGEKYLKNMLMLIVEGADSEMLWEIFTRKYFAEGLEGYEALQYIMMLDGCLLIRDGENPAIIEKKLTAMMADQIESQYYAEKEKIRTYNPLF